MLKNRFTIYVLMGLLSILFACQTAVDKAEKEEKTFIRFYSRYLQNDRLFRAEADFFIGDSISNATAVEMRSVHFQGIPMDLKNINTQTLRYKTERKGDFQSQLQFKYTDQRKGEHLTEFQLDPIESFLFKDEIRQSKEFTLEWKGPPLKADENLLLLFVDTDSKAATIEIPGPTSVSEATVSGSFLKDLHPGASILLLVRNKKGKREDKNIVVQYELAYYVAPHDVEIVP